MPEVQTSAAQRKNFRSLLTDHGLRGVVMGVPGSVTNRLAEFWRGQEKPEDPNAPRLEDFRNLSSNKGSLVDSHGLRVPEHKRKRFKTELEEKIRPDMMRMWESHISNMRKVFETDPGFFLHDKTSYAYHQLLQVKQFLNPTTDENTLGSLNREKLQTYFNTSAGYTETMRYFETEAFRLQCANDIIALTKNGYSPDKLNGINIGLSKSDILGLKTSLLAKFGGKAAVAVAFDSLIYASGIVGSLATLTPQILPLMPWIVPGMVVGAIWTRKDIEGLFTKNSPQQIIQMCDNMFLALQGPKYATECEYLRLMYGIDPRELRKVPGSTSQWTFPAEGSTTNGWDESRRTILEIKDLRRRLYGEAMDIDENQMYGWPEEAFIDTQGNFRRTVVPEGGAVKYQQEIWTRFYRLGGYQTYDASGALRDLTSLESLQRFHEARLQINMETAERNARDILATERKTRLSVQENQISTRVNAIDAIAAEEKKTYTDEATLFTELNAGVGVKTGLTTYLGEWKGSAAGSMEERLKGVTGVRKEVYDEVSSLIQYSGTVEGVSEKDIDDAIASLELEIDLQQQNPPSLGVKLQGARTAWGSEPREVDDKSKPRKTGGFEKMENPRYKLVEAEYLELKEKVKNIEDQIEKLKTLRRKLVNKLSEYQPGHEHSKAHEDALNKMQKAYDELKSNMGKRSPPITVSFDDLIGCYPGPFTVDVLSGGALIPETRSGVDGLAKTLGSETGLWREDENTSHEHRMTIIYAVAWKKVQDKIITIDANEGAKTYSTAGGAPVLVKDFWTHARSGGALTEMGVLAQNVTELGTNRIVSVGTNSVNMNAGANTELCAYIQARQVAYYSTVEELIRTHDNRKHAAEAQGEKVDERYKHTKDHYGVITGSIANEKGNDQNKKLSAQVHRHGLTGDQAIGKLCDIRRYDQRSHLEQDAYQDYERAFLLKHTDFPPAMLEFLHVLFDYRSSQSGKEMLDNLYAVLTEVVPGGGPARKPQDLLADIIYQSTPGLDDILTVSRDDIINNYNPATRGRFSVRYSWPELVLWVFNMRQRGVNTTQIAPTHGIWEYVRPCVSRHYSASEMNGVLMSIYDKIIEKVVNTGVI